MRPLPIPVGKPLKAWNDGPTEHFILTDIDGELFTEHFSLGHKGRWWRKTLLPFPERAMQAAVDFYGGREND